MTRRVVVLDERIPADVAQRLRAAWAECSFIGASGPGVNAEAFVHWGTPWSDLDPLMEALASRLRWVHTWTSGVDEVLRSSPSWLASATLTSSRGAQARAVAEYALSRMVHAEWFRDPPVGEWRELAGRRLAVLGLGAIGTELTRLATCVGMDVTALVRGVHDRVPDGVAVEPLELWPVVLPEVNFLVITVPLTPETERLVDRSWLDALPGDAVLVNVARGAIVDQEDLLDALRGGTIRAAYLDVTDPEPLPAGHPLWGSPTCFITPHVAGSSAETRWRVLDVLEHNLGAFCNGGTYVNVVDPRKGY